MRGMPSFSLINLDADRLARVVRAKIAATVGDGIRLYCNQRPSYTGCCIKRGLGLEWVIAHLRPAAVSNCSPNLTAREDCPVMTPVDQKSEAARPFIDRPCLDSSCLRSRPGCGGSPIFVVLPVELQ